MVTVYRSGELLPAEELRNDNAVFFDSHSESWLRMAHVPRSRTVFASMFEDDAWFWAERRINEGRDATIWAITLPDNIDVKAYWFKHYDNAMRALKEEEGAEWNVNAYWSSGTDVDHWCNMWSQLFEGYENSGEWEVLVDVDVAAKASWSEVYSHERVVEILHRTPLSSLKNSCWY